MKCSTIYMKYMGNVWNTLNKKVFHEVWTFRATAVLTVCIAASFAMVAKQRASEVRFHNERQDTVVINEILLATENIADNNERIVNIMERFMGTPYAAGTLETYPDEERLTVNLDSMDCTTFVETVLALASTAGSHRTSWRDYLVTLEGMRYRRGELDGYPSRLHYFSDWVVDNVHRGNVTDATNSFSNHRTQIKTLDYMSRNASKYPALADSANLAGVKNFEMGFRKHQYPYIPYSLINAKEVKDRLRDGDVVAILTKVNGLDVSHMGFIMKNEKGIPYLVHASSKEGKIILDKLPLSDYLKKNGFPGIRVIRMKE